MFSDIFLSTRLIKNIVFIVKLAEMKELQGIIGFEDWNVIKYINLTKSNINNVNHKLFCIDYMSYGRLRDQMLNAKVIKFASKKFA